MQGILKEIKVTNWFSKMTACIDTKISCVATYWKLKTQKLNKLNPVIYNIIKILKYLEIKLTKEM